MRRTKLDGPPCSVTVALLLTRQGRVVRGGQPKSLAKDNQRGRVVRGGQPRSLAKDNQRGGGFGRLEDTRVKTSIKLLPGPLEGNGIKEKSAEELLQVLILFDRDINL
jgi:hypothetical protein